MTEIATGPAPTLAELRARRAEILQVAARHGVSNIRVYGSVARGDANRESDVDFLVDIEKGRSLFDLGAFYADLEDLLGCKGDAIAARAGASARRAAAPSVRRRVGDSQSSRTSVEPKRTWLRVGQLKRQALTFSCARPSQRFARLGRSRRHAPLRLTQAGVMFSIPNWDAKHHGTLTRTY